MIAEQLGHLILVEYNRLLIQHPLYKKHLEALGNWQKLRSKVTGSCTKCGKQTKTHLHHKKLGIRPQNGRSIPLEIIYIPPKDILYLTPKENIEIYLKKFEVKKSIIYFGVKQDEVRELCPKCHKEAHNGI